MSARRNGVRACVTGILMVLGACTEPTTMERRLSRASAKAAVSITLRSRAMASSWVMRS